MAANIRQAYQLFLATSRVVANDSETKLKIGAYVVGTQLLNEISNYPIMLYASATGCYIIIQNKQYAGQVVEVGIHVKLQATTT